MNCDELKAHTHDYMERRLSAEQRAAVDEHAASCAGCAQLLHTAGELSCKQLADFLHDYIDDALPQDQRLVFDRHLALCPPCIDYLESYKTTIAAVAQSCSPCDDHEQVEVPEQLIRAILAARAKELD